jgi:Ca2+-binding EF-hand superfamily protein
VKNNWKDMRKEFKVMDKEGSGVINDLEFRRILRQFCANLSEDEFDTVATTFDKTALGLVSYNDFLKQFMV